MKTLALAMALAVGLSSGAMARPPEFAPRLGYPQLLKCERNECKWISYENMAVLGQDRAGILFGFDTKVWIGDGDHRWLDRKEPLAVYCSKYRPAVMALHENHWRVTWVHPDVASWNATPRATALDAIYFAACHNADVSEYNIGRILDLTFRLGYHIISPCCRPESDFDIGDPREILE